jgi:hydroxyethylthiazole kinase-like uncharacterized protein yjeF
MEQFGMHSLVLMENAGLQCVSWILRRFVSPVKTVVMCGPGNNGGDGLVITRHLRLLGWDCQAFLLGPTEKFSSDTRHHARLLSAGKGDGLTIVEPGQEIGSNPFGTALESAGLIIDSLLGTGASGNPRSPLADWIELANAQPAFRLAIDIPTGVNSDTGQVGTPYFHANSTLTFVALKPAMASISAGKIFGAIQVLPIGIPQQMIQTLLQTPESTRLS